MRGRSDCHDRRPDREVGHEVAVHHVDVEEVGLGRDAFDLVGELGEVGGRIDGAIL